MDEAGNGDRALFDVLIHQHWRLMQASALFGKAGAVGQDGVPEPGRLTIFRGMRGSGKTSALLARQSALVDRGEPVPRLLYLDFGDARLRQLGRLGLVGAVDRYLEAVPQARRDGFFLAVDGADELGESWAPFISGLMDTYRVGVDVALEGTGGWRAESLPASLAGRTRVHPMRPALLPAFARDRGEASLGGLPRAGRAQKGAGAWPDLEDYLVCGGFPGAWRISPAERAALLQGYVEDEVAGAVRLGSLKGGLALADRLVQAALAASGRRLSIGALARRLGEEGMPVARATLEADLRALVSLGICHVLSEYGPLAAAAGNSRSARTVFAADPGLARAFCPQGEPGRADALRCAVYLRLCRDGVSPDGPGRVSAVHSARGTQLDFAVGGGAGTGPAVLVRVVGRGLSGKRLARQVGGLAAMRARLGASTALMLVDGPALPDAAAVDAVLVDPAVRVRDLASWLMGCGEQA